MKIAAIICFMICAVLLFVAWERYDTNASNVEAMNQMSFGAIMGGGELKPATPVATKYALVFAAVSGVTGIVCLIKSGSTSQGNNPCA